MCGKPKRPRIPPAEALPPDEAQIRSDLEDKKKIKRKAKGLSSTILTDPLGVSKESTTTTRTLLGG